MKKLTLIVLSVMLLAAMMATPIFATQAEPAATVSNATGKPGETVYLTVSLTGFEKANTLAITVTPEAGLKLDRTKSEWLIDGMLKDINANNNGVWGNGDAVDVNKDIVKLAIVLPQVTETQTDLEYEVTCQVIVKKNSTELGTVTAKGKINVTVAATDLTLDKTALELDLKDKTTATLTATLTPANATDKVVWTSADETVATVDATGKVTAKKCGEVKITATAGSISKSCTVKVKCSHNLTKVAAQPATCKATGNNEYYTCSLCQAIKKADKTTDTTVAAETLAKLAHTFGDTYTGDGEKHWLTCTAEGCDGKSEAVAHTFSDKLTAGTDKHYYACTAKGCTGKKGETAHVYDWIVDEKATEDAVGKKHEECTCGAKRSENTEIPKQDHKHEITHHAEIPATCNKPGVKEYWTCSSEKCAGQFYGDKDGQFLISDIVLAVNPKNHVGETELKNVVAGDCGNQGYSGDTYCKDCGKELKKGDWIPATNSHTAGETYLTDADNHWQECTVCKAIIDNVKKGHVFEWITDREPTEDEVGLKHKVCTVCQMEADLNTEIEKLKHEPVFVKGKAATCTEAGIVDHYLCATCNRYYASTNGAVGEEIAADKLTIAASGHAFGTEWKNDKDNHWHVCACGEVKDKAAHKGTVVGAVDATATSEGYTGDTVCADCGYKMATGSRIPMLATDPPTEPSSPDPTTPGYEDPEENKTGVVIALIAGTVLALGGLGFGGYIFLKKRR